VELIGRIATLLVLALVTVYTVNYGRWALRRGHVRGAVGLFLLAAATFLVPGLMLLLRG
jgi:hypothetical protein